MPTIKYNTLKPVVIKKAPSKRAFKVDDYAKQSWRDYSYELRASVLKCCVDDRHYQVNHLVVDHIIPVNEGGSFWDQRNHQVMCKWHHSKKTVMERNGSKTPWELNDKNERIPKQLK